jgi:predicted ribosome quality control (RQC) complex YloA/Tae2 family protein
VELTLLRRLVDRLADELVDRRFDQAWALPPYHLAIAFGSRAAPRLWFSSDPEHPHLYLRPGAHPTPSRPPAFAMAVRKHARGRRVAAIDLLGHDRIVELRWHGGGSRLVFELVPRRATAMVLDAHGAVVAVWTPRKGRPEPGERYAPPPRRDRTPLSKLSSEERRELHAAAAANDVARTVLRCVAGTSGLIAREVQCRVEAGEEIEASLAAELERARAADDDPVVYAPVAPRTLRRLPEGRAFELSPYPLRCRQGDAEMRFGDLLEAAAFFYPTRARLALLDRARSQITQAAGKQRGRVERALARLRRARASQQEPQRLRQLGDLLLANPAAVPVDGAVTVPDLYADGEPIRIELDPGRTAREGADGLYRRAQRLERKQVQDAERLEGLEAELEQLTAIERRAAEMADLVTLHELIDRARERGLELRAHGLREPEAEGAPTLEEIAAEQPESIPGILRVTTPNGAEILVGRSASANDRLTHEIATRNDWWLHAVGPGSHVVLRNPEQLEEPRPGQLVAAARLAAWFSRARGSTKVEVHWTRAGWVRRPRGARTGQVLMDRFRTIVVEPAAPATIARGEP